MKQHVLPTVIIPIIHNERMDYYWNAAKGAIDSVFHQTMRPELIVSVEDSLAQAKNNGVRRARTEWCMFLDADDRLGTDFIENLYVTKGKGVGILKPQVYLNDRFWNLAASNLLTSNFLINGCVFKKEIYEAVGGTDERTYEDWHLWAKMIIDFEVLVEDVDSRYKYYKTDAGLNAQATKDDVEAVKRDIIEYFDKYSTRQERELRPKMQEEDNG